MSLWSDLLIEPMRNANGDTLVAIQRFKIAVTTGEVSGLENIIVSSVNRIRQAEEKIVAGVEIKLIGELLTLAQYGAGSIGKSISTIVGIPKSASQLEAIFIAKFLIEIVLRRDDYQGLFPSELLRLHGINRSELNDDSARPVLAAIVKRAEESVVQLPRLNAENVNRETALFLTNERKLLKKRLHRLTINPLMKGTIELNSWDRWQTTVITRLRKATYA
ncbi:MAG: hypothetical protein CFH41_00955 [Alphaproteobacteria bacterium MarineAlpha11_Bin1]|nr:MAG: hypothetical protein CFH41_00955 [Alphaproteobacteria bacterium MarineAlpha11_Bin1]|tara:strand:+ start:12353 stop:13012 length:660 start_codon:yes stop_codon:yes gene_type:complete